jgi:hypothetical protein
VATSFRLVVPAGTVNWWVKTSISVLAGTSMAPELAVSRTVVPERMASLTFTVISREAGFLA